MKDNALRDPDMAIGSRSRDHWDEIGLLQFDYLRRHGLQPHHRFLDIGCGNLRGGWRLIEFLDVGNYYGIDISPDILVAAEEELSSRRLQDRWPHITVVNNLRFEFLPDAAFDVIHAHSVFTHTRRDVIEECLASVGRILKDDGFFDFTYFEGQETSYLDEDFRYPTETLRSIAESNGLNAERLTDWEYSQQKIRVRRT